MKETDRYLCWFFALLGMVFALQFCIIRYGFAPYGTGESALGLDNMVAYRMDGRFVKTARISGGQDSYDIYMIGSSRLRDGLSPKTVTDLTGLSAFNYGLSGLLAKEMAPIVDHLLAYKKPKAIIIGLDFFAFNDATAPSKSMALGKGLSLENTIKLYLSVFSLKTIKEVWIHERDDVQIECNKNGFCRDARFGPEAVAHYIQEGLDKMGDSKDVLYNFNGYRESLNIFMGMLDRLERSGIKVVFFYSPAPVAQYERLREIGLYDLHQKWKDDVSKAILGHGFRVWDFNIKSPATTLDFEQSARYFNDDLHYTEYFGDIILKTILEADKKASPEYSRELTDR